MVQRQRVATHGNGFGLFEPLFARSDLPPVATGCARSALSEEGPRVNRRVRCQLSRVRRLRTCSGAPGRLDAHLFLGLGCCTPCRWELSRLLNSRRGRQAATAKRELAGTEVPLVLRGAGLKGWLRESMCQAAIRILRATAALAGLWLPERRPTSR